MKAVVWKGGGVMELCEVPKPKINDAEVLLKIDTVGVCGTDIDIYTKGFGGVEPPRILGHEFAGTVVEAGSQVKGIKENDRVTADQSLACRECRFCRAGRPNLCGDITALGFTKDGAHAEFLAVPAASIYNLPETVSFEEGTLIEPLADCIHGFRRCNMKAGDSVTIVGDGFFGLLFVQLARISGASRVILLGHHSNRLALGKEFGADFTLNSKQDDSEKRIIDFNSGQGTDIVVCTIGAKSAIEQSFSVAGKGARIVIFGYAREKVSIDFGKVHCQELEIYGAGAAPGAWEAALNLAGTKRIDLASLITHRYPLAEVQKAFEVIRDRDDNAIKAVIKMVRRR